MANKGTVTFLLAANTAKYAAQCDKIELVEVEKKNHDAQKKRKKIQKRKEHYV